MKRHADQPILTDLGPTCRDRHSDAYAREFGCDHDRLCDSSCFLRETRVDYEFRLDASNGLHLPDFEQVVPVPYIPPVVFDASLTSPKTLFLAEREVVVPVAYDRIGPLMKANPVAASAWRTTKGVPEDATLLVGSELSDPRLATLFRASLKPDFYAACVALRNAVFTSHAFSVYTDGSQCRGWQVYNLARSYRSAWHLNRFGLPVIVAIGADHPRDEERIAEHATRQGGKLTHFAVNSQTLWPRGHRDNFLFAKRIERMAGRTFHWLFYGVVDEASELEAYETMGRIEGISFVSSKPVMRGLNGRGLTSQATLPLTLVECVKSNIETAKTYQRRAEREFRKRRAA